MKFIRDELIHNPESLVSGTKDSSGQDIPVYKWTQALKEDVMCKLGKSNIQSLDPFYQLVCVRQDVWDLALALGQPASTREGGSHKLKPLTSITSFRSLAGLSDDEKLQLLTTLYKGDLDVGGLDAAAQKLKIRKQVKTAFLVDTNMTVKEVTGLLGKDIFHKEINCWTDAFTWMGKGSQ
jgi:hypothetical protein